MPSFVSHILRVRDLTSRPEHSNVQAWSNTQMKPQVLAWFFFFLRYCLLIYQEQRRRKTEGMRVVSDLLVSDLFHLTAVARVSLPCATDDHTG